MADEIRVARDRVAALETELGEAVRTVEEADSQAELLQEQLSALTQTATSTEVAFAEFRAETARGEAAAAARQEAATQEAERLRNELAAARQGIDAARLASTAAEARAEAATLGLREARAERDVARHEATQARADLRQIEGIAAREGARAEAAERRAADAEQRAQQSEEAGRVVVEQLTQAVVRGQVAEASAAIWREQAEANRTAPPAQAEAPAPDTAFHDDPAVEMAPAAAAPSTRRRDNSARGGRSSNQIAGPDAGTVVPGGAP